MPRSYRSAWRTGRSGPRDPGARHLDLVVTSLERSRPFYQELLGLMRASENVGEREERVLYLRRPGEEPAGSLAIGLREKQSDAHGVPFDR